MTHLECENLASEYLDETLDAIRRVQVEAHLASCGACREVLESLRVAIATCRAAPQLEPAPWLVARILHATTGDRKPGLITRVLAGLRPILTPQVVYGVSMAVFSLSFVLFAAKVNVRRLKLRELNPATWFQRADSRGHLLIARAERFYYDLRFVYEVQSVLRELRQQPSAAPAKPKGQNGRTSNAPPFDGVRVAALDRQAESGARLGWWQSPLGEKSSDVFTRLQAGPGVMSPAFDCRRPGSRPSQGELLT